MIYPKINFTKRGMRYQWRSTKTGFRQGGNSFWRWVKYPFTRAAWRRRKQLRPMTAEQADAAYDESPAVPMSDEEIDSIVASITQRNRLIAEDTCPECGGELDTGWECIDCGFDAQIEANRLDLDKHRRDSREFRRLARMAEEGITEEDIAETQPMSINEAQRQ